jgi:hypothetical protein
VTRADDLRAASAADDGALVRRLLADLPEDERTELIPVAREIVAAVKRRGIDAVSHLDAVLPIAYGILPVSDLTKLGWWSNWVPKDLDVVLRRRSPERLVPIVNHLLDDVGGGRTWPIVRPLVREGVVPTPDRPSYTIEMLAGVAYGDVTELLAGDPGLLDDEVWRLFEVEGGGEHSLANHEKFFRDRWGHFFRDLAARDPAMRERLLDVSLAALGRDFSTYRAGWFSRFHESLVPTDEERARRADAYLGLLRSRVGPTVSFAVAALKKVDRAGLVSADRVLDRVGPVLFEGSTGAAKAGLALVKRAGAPSVEAARRAAIVATEALGHESPEIQRAALDLVAKLVPGQDADVAKAIGDRLSEIAASQRSAATTLIVRLSKGEAAPPRVEAPAVVLGRPAEPAGQKASPLDADRAIEPVTSVEALIDLAVAVLETGEPADDVERLQDGIGRCAADRPESFSRVSAGLAKRARTLLARRESRPFSGLDARSDVAAVVLAWAAGDEPPRSVSDRSVGAGAGIFLSARAREVAEAAARRRPFLSVAAPTHTGGWLDPLALVERLASRPPASRIDLVAALLRLATDGRDTALVAARRLDAEPGAALRYALGGVEKIGPTAAWWVAAARVRAPGEDDPAVEARHPRLGPNAGLAARFRFVTGADRRKFIGGLRLEVEPPLKDEVAIDYPTVQMVHEQSSFNFFGHADPVTLRWMATIQPGDRETWAAVGAMSMAQNLDWWSALWGNRAFLEPFLDPVTRMGPQAARLAGIALGAKEAGERGLAADVVALALADGRLTAATLAAGLTAAAALGCDRPNRWALSLADVAAHSDGQAAVAEAVARALPALADRPPAKLVPLLRLIDELLAESGGAVAAVGRVTLERLVPVGGQAGRLAGAILSRA